jgi:hypothetical protein
MALRNQDVARSFYLNRPFADRLSVTLSFHERSTGPVDHKTPD